MVVLSRTRHCTPPSNACRMFHCSQVADATTTADLIADAEAGIYIVGDKSWSIDMQRFNFQFTGQRFHEIKNGKIVGQLKDVAYQSKTPDFWAAMRKIGGAGTYLLGGALNCGKGQPGQVAPVSHGCPSALFTGINMILTPEMRAAHESNELARGS